MPLLLILLLGGGLWYLASRPQAPPGLPTGEAFPRPGERVTVLVQRSGAEGLYGASTALAQEIQNAFASRGYAVEVTGAFPTGAANSVYKIVDVRSRAAELGIPTQLGPGLSIVAGRPA